jgi:glycosyltransferase involved in cell wall biosynthesis
VKLEGQIEMANVGIVSTWFPRGTGYVSRAYRQSLLSGGHDVFIYARGSHAGRDPWDIGDVTTGDLNSNKVEWGHFKQWLLDKKIDVCIFVEQRETKEVIDNTEAMGIKTIGFVDYYTKDAGDWDAPSSFNRYSIILCHTKHHLEVFGSNSKMRFIQWGTDTNYFVPNPKPDFSKARFMLNAGFIGKNGRKGVKEAIDAFKRYVYGNYDATLYIHAQRGYGGFKKAINCPAITVDIDEADSDELFEIYHKGNVFLYPSKHDGLGLSMAEALSSGLPTIATNGKPINEFVREGHDGFLIRVDKFEQRGDGHYWPEAFVSTHHLGQQMIKFAENPSLIETYSNNARNAAMKRS